VLFFVFVFVSFILLKSQEQTRATM